MRQKLLIVFTALCCLLAVLAELGADSILPARAPDKAEMRRTLAENQGDADVDLDDLLSRKSNPTPPGLAIRYLALYDGLLFVSLALMALNLFLAAVPKLETRLKNVTLLVGSVVDVILSFILALLAFAALLGMVALFLAAPFGTIAYLVAFGFFDTGRSTQILTFIFIVKIVGVVLVVLAGQINRRILLRFGIAIGLCVLVSFLHAFPPGFLVSIVDALAAIVVAIIALLFALPVAVTGVIGVVKSVRR